MTTATNLSIKIALFSALFRSDVILTSLLCDRERRDIVPVPSASSGISHSLSRFGLRNV